MFRNYLVTALRNVGRHKLYSFINIAGLTVALACAIFIMLFLADELSYDRWIPDTANLYRVEAGFLIPGHDIQKTSSMPFVLAPTMKAQIPEVTADTHLQFQTSDSEGREPLVLGRWVTVDPDFFQVIKLPLVEGDPARVFALPDSIVISQKGARKLFGTADPIGRTVTASGTHPMTVTGVMRDLPHNSQFDFDYMFPNTSKADPYPAANKKRWLSISGYIYVKLAHGADPATVLAKTRRIIDQNVHPKKEFGHRHAWQQGDAGASDAAHRCSSGKRLSGRHAGRRKLDRNLWFRRHRRSGSADCLLQLHQSGYCPRHDACARGFAAQGAGCQAQPTRRPVSRQIRAHRNGRACPCTRAGRSPDAGLRQHRRTSHHPALHRRLEIDACHNDRCIDDGCARGRLSGLCAIKLPSPAALRANRSSQSGSALLRTSLVVLQFAISIGLGVAAIVVFVQIRYAQTIDLGYNHSHVVVIGNADDISNASQESLVQALRAEPSIAAAARSESAPFGGSIDFENVTLPGSPEQYVMRSWNIEPGYLSLYGMKMLSGRKLSRDRAQDAMPKDAHGAVNVVVNAVAAHRLGFSPDQAIGKSHRLGWPSRHHCRRGWRFSRRMVPRMRPNRS